MVKVRAPLDKGSFNLKTYPNPNPNPKNPKTAQDI